jgi:hypothetical protein
VGNKTDKERLVSQDEAKRLAAEKDASYMEGKPLSKSTPIKANAPAASAKRGGHSVADLFEQMLDQIIAHPSLLQSSQKVGMVPGALTNITLEERQQDANSGCAC